MNKEELKIGMHVFLQLDEEERTEAWVSCLRKGRGRWTDGQVGVNFDGPTSTEVHSWVFPSSLATNYLTYVPIKLNLTQNQVNKFTEQAKLLGLELDSYLFQIIHAFLPK